MSKNMRRIGIMGGCLAALAVHGARAADTTVPAPGASTRIDEIKQRGELRVGALGESPWLKENATGEGAPFAGPGWDLASDYARRLGVKLAVVPVSHDTKVPVLAAGQVDVIIAPLAVTPQREQVVDFIVYSNSALCLFGLGANPKLAGLDGMAALNTPDVTVAYFTGTPPEHWLPQRLPKATLRGVPGSGANAPVDEILSRRADVAPIDNVAWPELSKKVPGLVTFPAGDACLQSTEMATPIGMAIGKGQPVLLAWMRAVQQEDQPALQQAQLRLMKSGE